MADILNNSDAVLSAPVIQSRHGLLEIAWNRKSLVLLGVVVSIVLGLLYYVQATPVYQAKAQLLVLKKRPDNVTGIDTRHLAIEDYVATQQALIKSPLIIERAIQKGDLSSLESFAGQDDMADAVFRALTVTRNKAAGPNTNNILDLAFRGIKAAECTTVLDAIIGSYKDFLDETYKDTSDDVLKLIVKAKDEMLTEIEKKEKNYDTFLSESPLLLLRSKEGSNLTHERLSSIEKKRSDLMVRKAELKGHLAAIEQALKSGGSREGLLAMVSEWVARAEAQGTRPPEKMTMQGQLLPLLMDEQKLLESKGEKHPEVEAIRRRIEVTRNFLSSPSAPWRKVSVPAESGPMPLPGDPIEMYRDFFAQQLNDVETSEKYINTLFTEEYDAAKALTAYETKDDNLRADIIRRRALYDGIVKRLQDVALVRNVGGYDARTIAPPTMGKKVAPMALLVFPVALLLGGLGGFGLALLAESRDKSFRNVEEVRRRLGLPVVGLIPSLPPIEEKLDQVMAGGNVLSPILCAYFRPQSVGAESYRGVRTALYFNTHGEGHKVIQITSPSSGDGKTK